MASIRVSELTPTATAAADSFLYLADTVNGGVDFDSKKITVANFLSAYATETFVNSAIENLINGAPEALDTLKEISDAIGDSGDIVGNLIGMINANETHMDNMATLSGVAKDETELGSFSGSTIGDGSDIKSALQALETSLETKASSSAVNSNVSNTNDLVSLSGMAAGSVNMGLFDGDTLSDNATLKVVLQSAETAIETNASAISSEASARAAAVTALTNGAVATNTSGVSTNAAAITALTNGAVASNTAAIAQEVTDRQAAVSAEATARADADALLMPKAGGTFTGPISGPVPTADSHLATKKFAEDLVAGIDLSQIETNRLGIISEASSRANADSALSGRLDVLEADPTTATALQAEATTRASADTALSNRVTSLEADPTTQTLLNAETTARTSADSALSGRLDTLEADPTTQTLLDAETSARIAGDALKLDLAGGTMTGDINLGASATIFTLTNTPNIRQVDYNQSEPVSQVVVSSQNPDNNTPKVSQIYNGAPNFDTITDSTGWQVISSTGAFAPGSGPENLFDGNQYSYVIPSENGATLTIIPPSPITDRIFFKGEGFDSFAFHQGGGSGASVLGVDGTATFGANVTASAVPTDDAHLVNKLYADNLVAGVDLSGIATNAAAIEALTNGAPDLLNTLNEIASAIGDDENFAATITGQISAEATTRASADTALSGRLDTLEADPTTGAALTAETNARTSADTALSGRLDVLEADPTTATALNGEISTRASADTALSGRLDVLEADPTTATALASEATTRANADTALSGRLDTLEADPTTATAVTSAIAAETAARQAADALLLPLAGGTMSGDIIFGGSGSTTILDLNFEDDSHGDDWVSFANSTHQVQNGANYSYLKVRRMGGTGPSSYIVIDTEVGTEYTVTVNFSGGQGTQQFFADPGTTPSGSGGISSPVNPRNGNNGSYTETFTATDTNYVLYLKLQSLGNNAFIHDISVTSAGSTTAAAVNVDGTALFVGNVTASAVPSDNAHLVNKLYADQLVANVDLSQVETNRLAIIQEISDRAAAITALTNGAVATNATNISANATAISQEVTDRAAAITALTNGQVATNTSGIATNATAITNLTNGAVADNAAAITALTNGAVADNAAAVTALANGAVATNAAAIAQEVTDRQAADALKVDKQSTVNEHMLGQTSAQSAPVDAEGNSNYLFLVVDKATGALKSIDKTFLEAE